jgi:hypothetical protein
MNFTLFIIISLHFNYKVFFIENDIDVYLIICYITYQTRKKVDRIKLILYFDIQFSIIIRAFYRYIFKSFFLNEGLIFFF